MRANKPSITARKVALNILVLGAKPGMADRLPAGIVDATAKLLIASGAADQKTVKFARSDLALRIYQAFEWLMPGQFEAFALRKQFFEQQVRNSIQQGIRQVLVLGAGYDTLGWRLAPEYPKINFFEIEHPATALLKAKGIKDMGQPDNLYLVAEDLAKRRLADVLSENPSWNTSKPTIIAAEGLLMYLPPKAVGELFKQCAANTGADSRFAFTFAGNKANGTPDAGPWSGLVLWSLKTSGEPWLWSINPDELLPFLNQHHWTLAEESNDGTDGISQCGIEFYAVAVKQPL